MLLSLPQETVNEIIAYLRSDECALQSLSVVAKRLTDECRRHLFASVHMYSRAKLIRWCEAISPGEDGLSRYVRTLNFDTSRTSSGLWWLTGQYLRSFTQVEQLKIRPLDFHEREKDLADHLSHFSPTVRSICIQPRGQYSAVLNFLALFPRLEITFLISPAVYEYRGVVDLPNLVCRGDLILKLCRIGSTGDILSCLTRPTTCYRSLGMGLVKVEVSAPLERFFETCGGSLESIQLICCFFSPWVHCPPTLFSSLTELREIKLSLRFFDDYFDVLTLLSSVTSTKIDTVTLFVWECPFPDDLDHFPLRWLGVENALCRLWELKKGTESVGRIVVDVHFDDAELAGEVSKLFGRGEFMPRFQEGGVVNIGMQPVGLNCAMASIMPEVLGGGFR